MADAVRDALNGQIFTGDSTLRVTAVMRQSRVPLYEPDELREVRILQDFIVWTKRQAA